MTKCWALHNGTVITLSADDQQTCGSSTSGAQFCCYSGDTCLEDSICQYTHPLVGGSGYYIGLCTDPSFPEPCSKSCSDLQQTDIVFTDASTSLWACCYQYVGDRDCSNPGNETFYAPSPDSLTAQAEPSPTTPSSATPSINSSITPSSTPSVSAFTSTPLTTTPTLPTSILPSSTTTTHSPPNPLSTGAKAGIGIAASTAGLGITLMLGFYLFRKRRAGRCQEAPPTANVTEKLASSSSSLPPTSEERQAVLEKSSEQQWELGGNGRSEMDGRGRGEMEAGR